MKDKERGREGGGARTRKEGEGLEPGRRWCVLLGLFFLQLKSVVRCRECRYQSVRFDPFTFLSLPLSVESTVGLEVIGKRSVS